MSWRKPFLTTVVEYSEVTTINGVVYVWYDKFSRLSRAFWFVVGWILIVCSICLIMQGYNNWMDNPVTTTVSTTGYQLKKISFPAITICGQGMLDAVLTEAIVSQVTRYITKQRPKGPNNFTLAANQTYKDLLTKNNLTYVAFLNDKYPGLPPDMDLGMIISILASPNPDAYLNSQLAVTGSYEQSQSIANSSVGPCDGTNYAYDPSFSYCYRLLDNPSSWNAETETTSCDSDVGEVQVDLANDAQLTGLAALIANVSSPLHVLVNQSFISTAMRSNSDPPEVFLNYQGCFVEQDGNDTDNCFEDMNTDTVFDNLDQFGFVFKYDAKSKKLNLTSVPGDQQERVLCMKPATSSGGTTTTTTTTTSPSSGGSTVTPSPIPLLEKLINPKLMPQSKSLLAKMKIDFKKSFSLMNLDTAYANLFEILWYSQLPCYDTSTNGNSRAMIKKCTWKGVDVPCSAIFNTFPTDIGMCCTFNMNSAEDIFKKTSYEGLITSMQAMDVNSSGIVNVHGVPDFGTKTKPVPVAGTTKGLTLILDAHTDIVSSGTVGKDYQGFLAIVGSPEEYPLLNQRNIRIRPGFDNLIGMSAVDVQADKDAIKKSIKPEKRNCYFSDEYNLVLHNNYTQSNCLLECQLNYANNVTAQLYTANDTTSPYCTPWYLPDVDSQNSDLCDPWKAQIYASAMLNVPETACDHCLPDCQYTTYSTVVSALPFRKCNEKNLGVSPLCTLVSSQLGVNPPIYAASLAAEYPKGAVPSYAQRTPNIRVFNSDNVTVFTKQANLTYDAYKEDIAMVTFYFESSTLFQFNRSASLTTVGFLGQLGGFLGLCNGFSLCSAIEIVFWFTCRLWYNYTLPDKEEKKKNAKELAATNTSVKKYPRKSGWSMDDLGGGDTKEGYY